MSYLVLPCSGLDKPEGSVAREVALRLADEAGVEIVCPVSLNRVPAKYEKALAGSRLVVVDGCATRCATKLAKTSGARISRVVLVSEAMDAPGTTLAPELRLGPDAIELARRIATGIEVAEATTEEGAQTVDGGAAGGCETPRASFSEPTEFSVVTHDKYEFRIPLTGFFFNANDVWAQVSGGRARVGISDYLQQRLTDIMFVDPPAIDSLVEQFGELGSVESSKASFEVISPVTGRVVAINEALGAEPERINQDPYASWIAEVELAEWEDDELLLFDSAAYAEEVQRKAAEE